MQAPAGWRVVDFISDLHLEASHSATVDAWQAYLHSTPAQALFILGDLFEVWVGDDAAREPASTQTRSFEAHCAAVLRQASQHTSLFFMPGNRDFLVGADFAAQAGLSLIADPSVLSFGGERWLLSHGDALCLDDHDYLQFRALVRGQAWQQDFLANPLAERRRIALGLRSQSQARKQAGAPCGDLDAGEVARWLDAAQAGNMIHGHTHRPADHVMPGGQRRWVLSDWDAAAQPPRAEVLRLSRTTHGPATVQRLAIDPKG